MRLFTTPVLWLVLLGVCSAQQTAPRPPADPPVPPANPQTAAPTPASVPLTASPLGAITNYLGLRVREIQFRGVNEDARVRQQLHALLAQKEDQPLDRSLVRRSIQALYATGWFSDLQVEAQKTPQNDVTLIFTARENYFVGSVNIQGNPKRPSANQLRNAAKLQLGELYAHDKIEAAIRNMQAVLADNGFYKAEITDSEEFHRDTQQVDIVFRIDPDGHAHIGQVTIKGTPGLTPERVQKMADFGPGHTVTAARVTKALAKLRKKYQKQGRLEAQVAITERTYHPQTNTLDYVFDVERGPTVDIQVEGAHIGQGKLKKLVPVYEEGAIDDDLLNEGLRNLRDYFQTQGFFNARVAWQKHFLAAENRQRVLYTVELGMKHKLVAVTIRGNKYFSTDLMRERMQIRPASGFLSHGLYSESMLTRDLQAVQALYETNGFQQVTIEHAVNDDYQGVKGRMEVVLHINEGPQVKVANLTITGNKTFDSATIEGMMSTIPGQPFSLANLSTDRESVLNFYFNSGFPNVQLESKATPAGGNPDRMDVALTINEGERTYVDRILVAGLNYTRPYVVRREFQVQPGEPLSQLGMLKTQQHLYDLGIFNEVDMAVQNPEGESQYKNLLFQTREAKRWTFNYGLGFEVQAGGQPADITQINTAPAPGVGVPPNTTPPQGSLASAGSNPQGGTGFSPRVAFDLTRINFRGRDHTISFKSHVSQLSKRALITYDAPHWWDRDDLRMTFTGWYDNSRDVRTFTSERLEGSAQLEWVATRISTLLWRYNYRRVKVDPRSLAISPSLVPLLSKPVRLGLPSFTYIRDKRNDPLDTTKGNYTTFDFGVSSKIFGSASVQGQAQQIQLGDVSTTSSTTATAANFLRALTQNSTYVPFRGVVLARTTKIGIEKPYGNNSANLAIPLPERFFAGGAALHRGFAINQAGPRDLFTGFPVGGNALFVNSVEARFPPPQLPWVGQNVNFVLFHDAGNVFQNATEMARSLFRWYQPHAQDCNVEATRSLCRFDYMSHAAGVGLRYRTPIGPLRVDFSYNFNPSRFPYYVQCPASKFSGEKAPCVNEPPGQLLFQNNGGLKHFNFFFSIGQSF